MNFLTHNRSLIFKTLLTQIVLSILGMMLYSAIADTPFLVILGTVFSVGIYWYLIYKPLWEEGCKEAIRIKSDQTNLGLFSGALIVLLANLPGFLLTLVPNLFPMRLAETNEIANSFSKVCWLLMKFFFNGQYTGILQTVFPTTEAMTSLERFASIESQLPFYLICFLPAVMAGAFGYYMGLKNRSLSALFGFETSSDSKK